VYLHNCVGTATVKGPEVGCLSVQHLTLDSCGMNYDLHYVSNNNR
jgi:hypothetical protein